MKINIKTKVCDECGSEYYSVSSLMAALCPECSHYLYGYDNCLHKMVAGRCNKCFWDGSTTVYIDKLKGA